MKKLGSILKKNHLLVLMVLSFAINAIFSTYWASVVASALMAIIILMEYTRWKIFWFIKRWYWLWYKQLHITDYVLDRYPILVAYPLSIWLTFNAEDLYVKNTMPTFFKLMQEEGYRIVEVYKQAAEKSKTPPTFEEAMEDLFKPEPLSEEEEAFIDLCNKQNPNLN